jgi:hypothetical protein
MEFQDRIATPLPAQGFADNNIGARRLAVGLAQGLFLYLILEAWQAQSWPATQPLLFTPLFLLAVFVPALLISSLGHFGQKQMAAWCGTAALVVVLLGVYGVWRMGAQAAPAPGPLPPMPWAPLTAALVPWFFIAHALVMAGVRDKRRLASYPGYFEVAWKLIVQLAFSALFVGVLWLVLTLGAQLFLLVRLSFLAELLPRRWFALPVTAMAWSCAMHVTDVRPAIVSNIRNLLLGLLSWILPVMTLLVGGFVLSLPFTGLAPLWATKYAATLLLVAAGAFVVLINSAWQEGVEALAQAPLPVRLCARIASLLLVPVTAIAGYALALRVGEYGWTSERVVAAASVLVASCYALGYAGAALRGRTLQAIAQVNIATALVVLATGLALLSPLADPVRLAVNSQVARLQSGKVGIEKFDFAWLRFHGDRYGQAALARLEAGASGPQAALLRERIAQSREPRGPVVRAEGPMLPPNLAANIHVWPKGTSLPDSFMRENWLPVAGMVRLPDCLRQAGNECDAALLDLTGDGKPEVLLIGSRPFSGSAVLQENQQGHWQLLGTMPMELAGCATLPDAIRSGDVRAAPRLVQDVEIAGLHVTLEAPHPRKFRCPEPKKAPSATK